MTNRREFLQIGVTATAWPLVARAAQATGLDSAAEWTPLLAVVYDPRFAESATFGQRCARLGLETHAVDAGDMTRIWYERMHGQWQTSPVAIAGLTAHGPMFCFTELARDFRMRVVFRAEHRAAPDRGVSHTMTGPVSMLVEARSACVRGGSLGAAMADVVTRCPNGRSEIVSASLTAGGAVPTGDDALYTWVIAPAVRV
jgi:hypothetical protein